MLNYCCWLVFITILLANIDLIVKDQSVHDLVAHFSVHDVLALVNYWLSQTNNRRRAVVI
jgi:hypothetical protein